MSTEELKEKRAAEEQHLLGLIKNAVAEKVAQRAQELVADVSVPDIDDELKGGAKALQEVAAKAGRTAGQVEGLLSGAYSMSLHDASDLAAAVGKKLKVTIE